MQRGNCDDSIIYVLRFLQFSSIAKTVEWNKIFIYQHKTTHPAKKNIRYPNVKVYVGEIASLNEITFLVLSRVCYLPTYIIYFYIPIGKHFHIWRFKKSKNFEKNIFAFKIKIIF